MTRERAIQLKENAEIMLIRMGYKPELKKVYSDVRFRNIIDDINVYLKQDHNRKEEAQQEGFFEPTPEELEEIAFMFS